MFNVGDYVICKVNSNNYTKYKSYKIVKIIHGLNFILHNDESDILSYHMESDATFNAIFILSEFNEYFYSPQELRKEKLEKLNNL